MTNKNKKGICNTKGCHRAFNRSCGLKLSKGAKEYVYFCEEHFEKVWGMLKNGK